jgi:methionyl-tRNA formyltransferase
MSTRILFAGSPAVAVPYLRALHQAEFDIAAVITRVDSPRGRKRVLTPTAVAIAAEELGLPVIKVNSLREVELPDANLGVIVAYGGLVPPFLLDHPTDGWINVHFSLLPEYRGAAPLQRAMWDGRESTGITIFRLVQELDAGPVLMSREIPFVAEESASEALSRISESTADEFVATVRLIEAGVVTAVPQIGAATFAPKFIRADGRVDWTDNAATISHRVRAVTSEPGAFTTLNGEPFGISAVKPTTESTDLPVGSVVTTPTGVFVATGDFLLELRTVTPPGKQPMQALDWARGLRSPVRFE